MKTARNRSVASAVSAILMLGAAPVVPAQSNAAISFDIRTQPLEQALKAFAERTGLQLIFPAEAIDPRAVATELVGYSTPREGLEKLLAGTRYSYEFVNARTVTIRGPGSGERDGSASAFGHGGAIRLAQSAPEAQEQSAERLEEVVVLGRNFNYDRLESANKMPMSVKDTPQAVKIITRDMLDFASVTDFNGMYKLDAGGHASFSGSGFAWSYFRGFSTDFTEAFKVDGFRVLGRIQLDFAPYERLEMVKGAVSTMYGQSSVSGTLNAVSKKPMPGFGGSASFEGGQWGYYRGDFDVYGSVTADDRLTFRLVGAYSHEDSYLDIDYRKQWVFAPSLKYQLGENTSVLLQLDYQKFDYTPHDGVPVQFVGDPNDAAAYGIASNYQWADVPRDRFGSAAWARSDREAIFARTYLEHTFQNDWMLRSNLQYSQVSGLVKKAYIGGYSVLPPDGSTDVTIYSDDTRDPLYSAEVNLFGDVEAFGRRHTLFFGADYSIIYNILNNWGYANVSGADTGFNIVTNPDYSLIPEPQSIRDFYPGGIYGDTGLIFRNNDRTDLYGLTAQLMAHPTDKLMVSLGARYSHSAYRSAFTCCGPAEHEAPLPPREPGLKTSKTTFQAGATYAITPDVNAYVTWGQTFFPRDARAFDGRELGPDEGETIEGGFKGELFDKRVFWSAAYFDTAKTNVLSSDPAHPGFQLPLGEERSRGVEADLQGRLLPGWDLYVSAAKMKAEYTEGDLKGITSFLAPKFGLSVFTSYTLQGGTLRGLGFGAGVVYKDRPEFQDLVPGGLVYPQLFSDFTEVDLRVFYEREAWRFDLIGTNVLDEKYRATTFQWLTGAVEFNPPRRVIAKVSYRFGGGSR